MSLKGDDVETPSEPSAAAGLSPQTIAPPGSANEVIHEDSAASASSIQDHTHPVRVQQEDTSRVRKSTTGDSVLSLLLGVDQGKDEDQKLPAKTREEEPDASTIEKVCDFSS